MMGGDQALYNGRSDVTRFLPRLPTLLLLAACTGGDDIADTAVDPTVDEVERQQLYPRHRLSRSEYRQEVRRLFGVDSPTIDNLPLDPAFGGFRNVASALEVSSALVDGWSVAAADVARRAVEGPGLAPEVERRTTWFRHHDIEHAFVDVLELARVPETFLWRDVGAELPLTARVAGLHRVEVALCVPNDLVDPAEVELTLDGLPTLTRTVTEACEAPAVLSFVTTLDTAPHLLAVRLLNGSDGSEMASEPTSLWSYPLEVVVVAFEATLVGPLDAVPEQPIVAAALAGCAEGDAACVHAVLDEVAARAWRRLPDQEERSGLYDLVDGAVADGLDPLMAVQYALRAILMSPHFLFRLEVHPLDEASDLAVSGHHPLDVDEVAARLSFFLWRSGPDQPLTECARSGALLDDPDGPCGLTAQAERLLADPRSAAFVEELTDSWLGLEDLVSADRSEAAFSRETAADMQVEARALIGHYVHADLPFAGLLHHDATWANDALAAYYELPLPGTGPDFAEVALPPEGRRGVLQLGGVLTAGSNEQRTLPPRRALWILEALYCTTVGPPPAGVPDADGATAAEAFALHASPQCAGCHDLLDPLGLALENWGPAGRWRAETPEGAPITVDTTLPGGAPIRSASELAEALRDDPEVRACLARKLLGFASGSEIGSADASRAQLEAATELQDRLPADPTFRQILAEVLDSPMFTHLSRRP